MLIENIPDIFISEADSNPELFVHDFRMTSDNVKSKVNLKMHMFSFLQIGKKQVHFAGSAVAVDKSQSILTTQGNCLWTELIDTENSYYCKLFFFSEEMLKRFLEKHPLSIKSQRSIPYFVIENDEYISAFIDSLSAIGSTALLGNKALLFVKFEEIMLYLTQKYGNDFLVYLHSLTNKESSQFREVIEQHVYSNLKIEEIAFLCSMSTSTFKRHFKNEYGESPGKWFQDKRLEKAKILLQQKQAKASDVYLEIGYNNLSNFSTAFKNKFGISPKELS